jgi:release factor glutamine methyltransferase
VTRISDVIAEVKSLLSSNPHLLEPRVLESESDQLVRAAWLACRTANQKIISKFREDSLLEWSLSRAELAPLGCRDQALKMARRRAEGEPLQYILGVQTFLDFELEVGPGVLIPRPETEILVVTAIERLRLSPVEMPQEMRGAEVGVGSGAICISLLREFKHLQMLGSELSDEALVLAKRNLERMSDASIRQRMTWVRPRDHEDVLECISKQSSFLPLDFIISNPPYLTENDELGFDVAAFEPHVALFAPPQDPLFFYRRMSREARGILKAAGRIFLEVPHERAADVALLFKEEAWKIELLRDLTGRNRVLIAQP